MPKTLKRDTNIKTLLTILQKFLGRSVTFLDLCVDSPALYYRAFPWAPPLNPYPLVEERFLAFASSALPQRGTDFNCKMVPQEAAFLQTIHRAREKRQIRCWLDVGGGNGDLAYLVKLMCEEAHVVIVDRDMPYYRRDEGGTQRLLKDIFDVAWHHDTRSSDYHTGVLCKHLCGTSLDRLLRSMITQGFRPCALVLAPCCYHKGNMEEFLGLGCVLPEARRWDPQDIALVRRYTGWSDERHHGKDLWRSDVGRFCERALDLGRIAFLEQYGYRVEVSSYVSREVTPKNTMITAILKA